MRNLIDHPSRDTDFLKLFFLNAGVGPMQGQANHFSRYAPEHIEYGVLVLNSWSPLTLDLSTTIPFSAY